MRRFGKSDPPSAADIPAGVDASKIGSGAVSNTEFGYLDGVTSAIQTQLTNLGSADTALAAPSYVTLATTATLANERVLTGTTNQITVTDNGAGNTVVLATPQNLHTGASPTFAGQTLTAALQLTGTQTSPGSGITSIFRGSSGEAIVNGGWFQINVTNAQHFAFGNNGITFTATQNTPSASSTALYRDASGNIVFNGGSGGSIQFGAGNYVTTTASDRGIGFIQDCSVISAAMGVARYSTGLVFQTTTVGNVVQRAKLQTRANSTTYSLGSLVAGDVGRIVLLDSQDKQAVAKVSTSGVVTFTADSHADYVASGSPGSGEVGVFVSGSGAAQVINIRPGSAATRGIAAFDMIGVA